jgi:Transposase family tnp2
VFAIRPVLGSNLAWPILLTNYNITPEVHIRLDNLLPVTIISGPNGPKCRNSFFMPLIEEHHRLAHGVRTYNATTNEHFNLHAYLILFSGDLPAMSKLLCLRGNNAYCPCHFCLIQGEHNQTKRPGKKTRQHIILHYRCRDDWDSGGMTGGTLTTYLSVHTIPMPLILLKSGMLNQLFVRKLECTMGSTDCHNFFTSNRSDSQIHFHMT